MLAACGREGGREEYVARVNGAILTEADIARQRDSLGETVAASKEYVNDWVVSELLYQEAERRGLTSEDSFRQQLEATRKRLAVAALLQEVVYARVDSSAVSEDSIAAEFARSGQSYLLREDITLASLALFRDRDAANTFRTAIMRGASWDAALAAVQSKYPSKVPILRSVSRQFFSRAALYPDELWKLARSLAHEELSTPLRTDEGYVVLRTHQNFRQGEVPPLEYARNEVAQRLLMDLRRYRYNEFLRSLRKRYAIDIRESHGKPDASETKE
jgi:hypothetical protein